MQGPPSTPVIVQVPDGPSLLSGGDPSEVYEAFRAQRSELRDQLQTLESQRRGLTRQLQEIPAGDAARTGIETRITQTDQRISNVERLISEADAAVARSAAVPGAVVDRNSLPSTSVPEEVFVLTGVFMFIVILPLTIAYARRIWRRGAATVASIPQEIYERFNRLDQAVDSVAIEVERIGEGQRFLTKLQTDQKALGAGPAQRLETPEREADRLRRGG